MRRQPDFATRPRPRRLPGFDAVLVAAGLFAVVASGVLAWRARDEAAQARAKLAEVRREVAEQARRVPPSAAVAAQPSPARVLAAVVAALPAEVRLEKLAIDYARGTTVEMDVEARDAAAWDAWLHTLARSPAFTEVAPGPESREGEVRSAVRARWSGGVP